MNIKSNIVANGHGYFTDGNPKYFAVHCTDNPGATAANHCNYWRNSPNYAVHFVSDWKEAYQCVPLDRYCWQVGNGNKYCIGLEICEATNTSDFNNGLLIARAVILSVLNTYGWTVDGNIRSHKWFTEHYGGSDHTDPIGYLSKFGWSWDDFINFLKEGEEIVTPEDYNNIAKTVWGWGMKDNWSAQTYLENANDFAFQSMNQLTRTDDPTGRQKNYTLYDHVKWMAYKLDQIYDKLDTLEKRLDRIDNVK